MGLVRALILVCFTVSIPVVAQHPSDQVERILESVATHEFHPIREGFTFDRDLNTHGVARLEDQDWRVRVLAVRNPVRLGLPAMRGLLQGTENTNAHVRQVAAMTMGIIRATNAAPTLEKLLRQDLDEVVRSQAAVSLGQIGLRRSLAAVQTAQKNDASRDVQHQAELAAYSIEHGKSATPDLMRAWAGLDEDRFGRLQVGQLAPDFELSDTEGRRWRLADFRGKQAVVLIWVFADWCPVCHGEFRELIELRKEFEAANLGVLTLECHDLFASRVMVGKELEPRYWFSKTSFNEAYTRNIWWPHLADRAGAVGVEYGVQPLAFTVHAEWINRPSVAIVDKEGIASFAYYGTFWGDRPSIHQLLQMVRSGDYSFAAPKRLKPTNGP
jgi:alkyl hydroperoxide reductase subunit AhpC